MKAFGYLAGSLLFQAMWGASLVFTIKMFMQWKHLKPEQQVALCVDLAQMTLDVFNKVPSILKGCVLSTRECLSSTVEGAKQLLYIEDVQYYGGYHQYCEGISLSTMEDVAYYG